MTYNKIFNPINNKFIDVNSIESKYILNKYLQKAGSTSNQTDELNLESIIDLIEHQLDIFAEFKDDLIKTYFLNNPAIAANIELLIENLDELKEDQNEITFLDNLSEEEAAELIDKYKIELSDDDYELEKMINLLKSHLGYSYQEVEVNIDEMIKDVITQYINSPQINNLLSKDEFQKSISNNLELLSDDSSLYKQTEDEIKELLESGESDILEEYLEEVKLASKEDLKQIKEDSAKLIDNLQDEEDDDEEDDDEDNDENEIRNPLLDGGSKRIYIQKGSGFKNWAKGGLKIGLTIGLGIGLSMALAVVVPAVLGAVTGLGSLAFAAVEVCAVTGTVITPAGAYAGAVMPVSASIGGLAGWTIVGSIRRFTDLAIDKAYYKMKGEKEKYDNLKSFSDAVPPGWDSKTYLTKRTPPPSQSPPSSVSESQTNTQISRSLPSQSPPQSPPQSPSQSPTLRRFELGFDARQLPAPPQIQLMRKPAEPPVNMWL